MCQRPREECFEKWELCEMLTKEIPEGFDGMRKRWRQHLDWSMSEERMRGECMETAVFPSRLIIL